MDISEVRCNALIETPSKEPDLQQFPMLFAVSGLNQQGSAQHIDEKNRRHVWPENAPDFNHPCSGKVTRAFLSLLLIFCFMVDALRWCRV